MEDATFFDELSYYVGEEAAKVITEIISAIRASARIVAIKNYRVIEIERTLSPSTYAKAINVLTKHLQPTPPLDGRTIYVKLGTGYAVIAIVRGMKINIIIVIRGDEDATERVEDSDS